MYAWKCWRDSCDRVILYAAASLAVGIMVGSNVAAWYHVEVANAWFYQARYKAAGMPWMWNPPLWAWEWGFNTLSEYFPPAAIWAALSLAAVSVGREYGSGAMPYLLTRPASRRRFVWTDWSLGLLQMLGILATMWLGVLSFLFFTSRAYIGRCWPLLLEWMVMAAALYGLTHFMTALSGSSMKGLSATAAVILFYLLLPGALEEWWHISWPLKFKSWSLDFLDWGWRFSDTHSAFHIWPLLMWCGVAVVCALLSQFILERREV